MEHAKKKYKYVSITYLLIYFIVAANSVELPFFTAGVVEFQPIMIGMSSADMLSEHIAAYENIIMSPEAEPTDILVFPEGTLNNQLQATYVPHPKQDIVLCEKLDDVYASFLVRLSCAARKSFKYIVVNLSEKEDCPSKEINDPRPCALNGLNNFNTNVVFNREGRIISRYRKVNVYVEQSNTTWQPEFAVFETDFGVKFGHFICFDLLFYTPALEMVERLGVKNVIFTSWFYSELPFLTAVQLHQSWSWATNVNFLAAGASYPKAGTTGSGIYAGSNGQLITFMATNTTKLERRLLVSKIYKEHSHRNLQSVASDQGWENDDTIAADLKLLRDPEMDQFKSVLLPKNLTNVEMRLCHHELCCNFTLHTINSAEKFKDVDTNVTSFYYRLGVYNGERSYEKSNINLVRICALYTCINESVSSCGVQFPVGSVIKPSFHIKQLRIEGEFPNAAHMLIMPNSLMANMYPIPDNNFVFTKDQLSHSQIVQLETSVKWKPQDQSPVLTFAIYANYYDSNSVATRIRSTTFFVHFIFVATSLGYRSI